MRPIAVAFSCTQITRFHDSQSVQPQRNFHDSLLKKPNILAITSIYGANTHSLLLPLRIYLNNENKSLIVSLVIGGIYSLWTMTRGGNGPSQQQKAHEYISSVPFFDMHY